MIKINKNSKPKIPEIISKMRVEYRKNNIPTILDDSLNLLLLTESIKHPKNILEIGTATGMSGICLLNNCPQANLVTIEKDEKSFLEAKKNFEEFGCTNRVRQLFGDAGEVLNFLDGSFDFVFLDGAKSKYLEYMPDIKRLLTKGGVLFADNVLFRGYVEGINEFTHSDNTIVRCLRDFIFALTNDDSFTTQVLNVGDGILISYKIYD